jgi:hypothetical protein
MAEFLSCAYLNSSLKLGHTTETAQAVRNIYNIVHIYS